MAQKLKFGNGTWATKEGSTLAYSDTNNAFKPLPFTTTRNSIATRVNKQGLIEVVGNDIPRIDYTDSAEGVLLLENSATNYVKHSESIDSWSTGFSSLSPNVVTADYAQGVYSNTVADRIQLTVNSSNTVSQVYQVLPITSGECTASVWLKSLSGTPTISIIDGYNTVGSFKLVTLTNEWVRHTLTFTATASDFIPQFLLLNGTTSSSADFLAYGFQVENGSVASSYIPTSGSSVTRQADTASGSGNSEVYGNNGGVLFWNAKAFDNMGNLALTGSNGTNAERFQLYFHTTTSDRIKSNVVTGNVAIAPMQSQVLDVTTFHKCANSFANNNHALWVDGFKVDTDTNGGVSQGVDRLNFDNGTGTSDFYGNTKEIAYYDTALTDEELEYLTSYRSLNELVTELNLNTL